MGHFYQLFCVAFFISSAIVSSDDSVGVLISFQDYFNKNTEKNLSDVLNRANIIKVPCKAGYKRLGTKCRLVF